MSTMRMTQTARVMWMTELTPSFFKIQLFAAKMGSSTMHVTVMHSPISISLPPAKCHVSWIVGLWQHVCGVFGKIRDD